MTHFLTRTARALLLASPFLLVLGLTMGGPFARPGFGEPESTVILLEVRADPEILAGRLADLPVRIRLAGRGWALVEVASADRPAVETIFPAHRRLTEAPPPLLLVQVRESEFTADELGELEARTIYRDPGEDLRVLLLATGERATSFRLSPGGADLAATLREDRVAAHLLSGFGQAHLLPDAVPPRSLAALPAAELANPYRRSRLADPAVRDHARSLAGEVDGGRIEGMVANLSQGPGATRYSGRRELAEYVVPLLVDSLMAIFSAPGDIVYLQPFTARVDSIVGEVVLQNVIARRPGRRPGSGRYVLGAHYDSIARRTEGWNPATDEAPGADDNASGTACVVEAARVLAQDLYDFDLEVVLFSGEEQVLLGSQAYTADSLAQMDDVLGAIVLDMVGYNPRAADSLNVLANLTSEWLADLMRDAEAILEGENGLDEFDKAVRPTLNYSDHASFWNKGASAILLIENVDIVAHNPFYHQTTDNFENLIEVSGTDLMRRTTEVVVATLGQFAIQAQPRVSFSVPPTGLLFFDEDGDFAVSAVVGESVESRTRVLNDGTLREGPVDIHATLAVGGRVIAEGDTSFSQWGSGIWHDVILPWAATRDLAGSQIVRSELALREGGNEVALLSDNGSFEVRSLVARDLWVVPNPVRGTLSAGHLRVRLTGQADFRCWVIDAMGSEVGQLGRRLGVGTNRVPLADMVNGRGSDLPSGVYLLRFELREPGGGSVIAGETVKFAYAR